MAARAPQNGGVDLSPVAWRGCFDLYRVLTQSHTCSGGLASDIQIPTWSSSKFCRAFFVTLLLVESALARIWLRSPWTPWHFHFTRFVSQDLFHQHFVRLQVAVSSLPKVSRR